ncbi:MAG: tetratricopeptide repeat protein, partial [Methanomassiliicoccales archaeon]|nr:tetratricopeptide repeat protein [Methanomassiliicoccales archaeon]
MNDLGLMIDESLDARIIKAVRDLRPEEFRELAVRLLESMGLKVTAAALSDDVVFAEGSGKEGSYLVMVSKRQDHASIKGLKSIKDKAATEGRLPALVATHEFEKEALDFAKSSGIAIADRPKFLALMKRYDLAKPLLKEVDKRILEREGDRFLPSVGKLDDVMESADDDIEHARYREALSKLDRALELKPTHYAALQKKTSVLMELGDYEEALATCRKAAELMPNDASSWYLMGLILHELGDLGKEIEACDMALKFSPRMAAAMLNKGATLFQLGRLEEALSVYESMLKFYPNSQRALNNRGLILKAMKRSDEALQSFDAAAAIDPSFVDPLVNKGSLLSEMGKLTEAIESLREAVKLQRGRSDLWMKLGLAQKTAGMFEEAAKSFAVAAVLDPTLTDATRERDEALAAAGMIGRHEVTKEAGDLCREYMISSLLMKASGELEGALDELEKCIEMKPSAPEVYLNQAGILLELGRLEEALVALKEGVREDPRNNELRLDLEALTYRLGRKEDCLRLLEGTQDSAEALARRCLLLLDLHHEERAVIAARESGGDHGRLDRILAIALIKQGKYKEASEVLRKCLDEFPGSPELLSCLGVCLRFAGELDEAENVLNEAVQIAPIYADAWNNLGCVLYVKGALEEAEKCLSEALLIDRRPAFLLNVGMCRLSTNDLDGAQELFTSALRIEQSADALNALGIVSERKKEIIKALELYEAALEKAPSFQDAL